MRWLALLWILVAAAIGCASSDWSRARTRDTPAAYRSFLAQSPDSPHAAEARERLAYLQLKRKPMLADFERFRERYPQSTLLPELLDLFQDEAFEAARREGSVAAYDRFLADHPAGPLSARAEGNRVYLREGAFAGRPHELARFVERHPESDYVGEARRTLEAADARNAIRFRRVGLRIRIDTPLADAPRLVKTFSERAQQAYGTAGIALVPVPPGATRAPTVDGWLTIQHSERSVGTRVEAGRMMSPGILAETHVTLQPAGGEETIWSETFSLKVAGVERRSGGSILFSPRGSSYWSRFFVPLATWPSQRALRPAVELAPGVADVVGGLDRATALFSDGSFRVVDLADPAEPRTLGRYARPKDLARFVGALNAPGRLVLYGDSGVEVVTLAGAAPQRARSLGREAVGSVIGVELVGDQLLIAGSRGLLRTPLEGGPVETLAPGVVQGLARVGESLLVMDAKGLHRVPLHGSGVGSVETVARLPRGLDPTGLRLADGMAVVMAPRALLAFDVRDPRRTRQLFRIRLADVGVVNDAVVVAGRIFVVGERGLQVIDARLGRVVDSVDVEGRMALAVAGRHLVVAGADRVQLVDATPWVRGSRPAAPAEPGEGGAAVSGS